MLGGGGSTGNAWLIGLVAGLADAELDITGADRTIGTSAGATAAMQLGGATAAELFEAALVPITRPPAGGGSGTTNRPPRAQHAPGSTTDFLARTNAIIAASADAAEMRRRMGAAALENPASSDPAAQARWRSTVAARLPGQDWPERHVLVAAVDAESGEPVVFDRESGIEPADAVAASCSSSFAYRIGDRRFIDGGYRRNENADLALGCARVLVLSPLGGRTRHPLSWGMQLAAQVDELRRAGSAVETVFPDSGSEHLLGVNAMDLSKRPAAARAGFDQGRALAERLSAFWS